jgi:peptidoglycan hydrolase-like protein with peptidoglycan-binding domain
MEELQAGVSGQDVKKLQKALNEFYKASVAPESGEFDEDTTKAVKKFQKDMKLQPTGRASKETLALLEPVKAYRVKLAGKEIWLSEENLKHIEQELCEAQRGTVQKYVKAAQHVADLYGYDADARDNSFFLAPTVIGFFAKFPPKSVISAATKAADAMQAKLKAGDPVALKKAIDEGRKPIEDAAKAMDDYRAKMDPACTSVVDVLTTVVELSKVAEQALAAIATAGASTATFAAVNFSVGAYEETLDQVKEAGTSGDFKVGKAAATIIGKGALDAILNVLLKDDKLLGKILDRRGKEAGEWILKKYGKKALAEVAEKMYAKSGAALLKRAAEDVFDKFKDPTKKLTEDEFLRQLAEAFFEGAAGGVLSRFDGQLENFSKNAQQNCKPYLFKGLGKVDFDKAYKEGLKGLIDLAIERIGYHVILDAAGDEGKQRNIDKLMAEKLSKDPKLNADIEVLVKKKKLQ